MRLDWLFGHPAPPPQSRPLHSSRGSTTDQDSYQSHELLSRATAATLRTIFPPALPLNRSACDLDACLRTTLLTGEESCCWTCSDRQAAVLTVVRDATQTTSGDVAPGVRLHGLWEQPFLPAVLALLARRNETLVVAGDSTRITFALRNEMARFGYTAIPMPNKNGSTVYPTFHPDLKPRCYRFYMAQTDARGTSHMVPSALAQVCDCRLTRWINRGETLYSVYKDALVNALVRFPQVRLLVNIGVHYNSLETYRRDLVDMLMTLRPMAARVILVDTFPQHFANSVTGDFTMIASANCSATLKLRCANGSCASMCRASRPPASLAGWHNSLLGELLVSDLTRASSRSSSSSSRRATSAEGAPSAGFARLYLGEWQGRLGGAKQGVSRRNNRANPLDIFRRRAMDPDDKNASTGYAGAACQTDCTHTCLHKGAGASADSFESYITLPAWKQLWNYVSRLEEA